MYLRSLMLKDAPFMLEWMHDDSVVQDLKTDFSSKTIDDCIEFIKESQYENDSLNLAISDDNDEYMGTVSLKHITNESAEFAIAVRTTAMGKGYSWFGMESIINKAFSDYGLSLVYWCVSKENKRAVRFYEKHGFREMMNIPQSVLCRYNGIENLKWYVIHKGFLDNGFCFRKG
ncbi:MAG: GNAT family N-acetyltransferase [Methanobrevibacter sp.]|nr:GNAT family N-acetyltransferase [Methanobrevibacter sp.]